MLVVPVPVADAEVTGPFWKRRADFLPPPNAVELEVARRFHDEATAVPAVAEVHDALDLAWLPVAVEPRQDRSWVEVGRNGPGCGADGCTLAGLAGPL
jgi:hypothetical protein